MNAFVWTMLAILCIEVVCKAFFLGTNHMPERTPGAMAADLCLSVALIAWAVYILARQS